MAERYSLTDIEGLAAHLATVLARHAEGHATAHNVADTALGWAADHGFARTEQVGPTSLEEAAVRLLRQDRDRCAAWADRLAYAIGTVEEIGQHSNLNDPWVNALDLLPRKLAVTQPPDHAIPNLAGFTRRAGIDISDLDEDSSEAAIALGHWPEADAAAAFGEHAHFQWGDDTKRPTRIRRGWVVNAGNDTDWHLVPSAADVATAFRVTYWEY